MIRDAADLAEGQELRAPVCVIGAGPAGITLALELAERGVHVLLLEGGGLDPTAESQELYEGVLSGAPMGTEDAPVGLTDTHLRYLGGTSNHWSGFCRPFQPIDFERRSYLERSGWPISRADLDPYYDRAREYLSLPTDRFDPGWWQEHHGLGAPILDSARVGTVVYQVSPVRFGTRFRGQLEDNDRIELHLNATVVQLRTDGGDSIRRIECRSLDGVPFTVSSEVVVVALGGVETPRLLLASTSDRPAGLGNENDLVGRYFSDHLNAIAATALFTQPGAELRELFSGREMDGLGADFVGALHVLLLSDATLEDRGLLGLELRGWIDPFSTAEAIAQGADGPDEIEAVDPSNVGALMSARGTAASGAGLMAVLAEQELNPASRVSLLPGRDRLGLQTVEVHWAHTDLDRRSILAGLEMIAGELGAAGQGRLRITPGNYEIREDEVVVNPAAADPDGFHLGVGFHHMCTTRMSGSPTEGVVDADLRVHSVPNLYVASSAAFGTPGAGTPTFTILALAIRLADHLTSGVPPRVDGTAGTSVGET